MAIKRKGAMTLAEHHARLKAEGKWDEYIARKTRQDEELHRKNREYRQAQEPLVKELRAAGYAINSVWDFVNDQNGSYSQALPILLDHLQRPYPDAIREGIARAIAVPAAKSAWPLLVMLYKREPERRTKNGLAVALANIANNETLDELIALAKDARHGESRLLLLSALERSSLPKTHRTLLELESDPALTKEVRRILRRPGVKTRRS